MREANGEAEGEGLPHLSPGERQRLIATSFDSSLLCVTACSLITPTPRACHFSAYLLVDRAVLEREQRPLEEAVRRPHGAAAAEHLGLVHGRARASIPAGRHGRGEGGRAL